MPNAPFSIPGGVNLTVAAQSYSPQLTVSAKNSEAVAIMSAIYRMNTKIADSGMRKWLAKAKNAGQRILIIVNYDQNAEWGIETGG